MKHIIIHTVTVTCFLLMASLTTHAQQAAVQPEKTAAPARQTQQPVTVSETSKPVEPKTAVIKTAPAEKRMPVQNIDRPKTSTIVPDKTQRPLANEGPKAPDQQQ